MPIETKFITHLRYLFLRARNGKPTPDVDDGIGEVVRQAKPLQYATAERLALKMEDMFAWNVGREEILYLALHVSRLTARDDTAKGTHADT